MNFSSKLIEDAVEAFAKLPGIGRKTALRLVLHLVSQPNEMTEEFADALVKMRKNIKTCKVCHNISDAATCTIDEPTAKTGYFAARHRRAPRRPPWHHSNIQFAPEAKM